MLQCFLGGRIRCFLFILDFTYTFPTQLLLFVNFLASSSRPRSVDCKATSRSYRVKTGRLVVPVTTPFPGIHKYKPHWTNGWLRGIPEVWILHSLHSQMTQTPVCDSTHAFSARVENTTRNVVSEFLLSSVFWGGRARFCHIFLGYGWTTVSFSWAHLGKMAGHWTDLHRHTPSSMPAPRNARKAWAPECGRGPPA